MDGVVRGRTGSEQLLVLWTWLLEGYVPVPHIVVDLDEPDVSTLGESADAPHRHTPRASMRLAGKNAA